MRTIEGKGRLERVARAVAVATDLQLKIEQTMEAAADIVQTPHSVTMEFELPNNERWVVVVTGKEVLLR